ncbi:colorectal mutant cancer protein-like isoform x1 [Plakobranchus ocellatus]|uniref:Colorectal mutant cancer protein-like isoform x1 n=1 Tax=Plakobranchus ocellatus TaxID=259542 RepID=A0AAV4CBA6_9GAST|nr:colorectal mutant cancer protein-like isoform x1 [Plakobranchus ocellatus]
MLGVVVLVVTAQEEEVGVVGERKRKEREDEGKEERKKIRKTPIRHQHTIYGGGKYPLVHSKVDLGLSSGPPSGQGAGSGLEPVTEESLQISRRIR